MLAEALLLVCWSVMSIHGSQLHNKEAVNLHGSQRSQPPDLCSDSSFDAIFEYSSGDIYVMKGEYYWKLAQDGVASGYPLLISHCWLGLPSDIDAATATREGLTYFFKGNKYWVYHGTIPYFISSCYISVGWPGIPDNVNGVTWAGDLYWRYDASQFPEVPASYPKPVAEWGSIEGHVDDVLYVNSGYMYFFTNGSYYRYNCATAQIDSGYPCPTSWWFQCKERVAEGNVSSSEPSTAVTTTLPTATNTTTASSTTTVPTTVNTTVSLTTVGTTAVSAADTVVTTTSNVSETDYIMMPEPADEPAYVSDNNMFPGERLDAERHIWKSSTASSVSSTLLTVVSLALIATA